MSHGKRYAILAGLAVALAAGGLVAYFSADSRAKEKPAAKGPGAVPVAVAAALQQSIPVRLQAIGNVEAYTSVAVKSRVDGQILEVHFREGQEVKKGEVLLRIDARPFEAAMKQAEAQALRDAASRDQALSQERRYQELLDKNFVSKDAYAQYRTNAQTAQASAKASEAMVENAKLNLDYTVIRSPIDGYVGRALLQAGNMVKANDTISLVVINQVKPVYVSFAIPEQQLATVRDLMRKGPLTVEVADPGTDKLRGAERPAVADADNAFLDVLGFLAPAGVDPHELGKRRVAWLDKFRVEPASAGADPGIPTLDPKTHRSQALTQVIEACRAAIARACDSALERVKGELPLSGIEALLIPRYEMMLRRGSWREIRVTPRGAPRVPYEGAIEAQRFMLIRLRNVAAAGDVEGVRAVLTRDLVFWRAVLGSSDTLISKMMALAAIRQHFTFGSFVLRELPKARAMEAIPAQWRDEFTLQERSMLRPMAGEFMFAEELLQTGAGKVLVSPEAEPDGVLDKLSPRKARDPTLSEIADTYLSVAEAFQVPLSEYEDVAARTHGKHPSNMGRGVSQYALRVGSAEGMRRAALLTVELRSQSVPVAALPEKLSASSLRNPYDGQPFVWDASDQAIVFTGPESREYRRQAYPY